MNHVVLEDKKEDNKTNVKSYSLDEILGGRIPQFIKIDVEDLKIILLKEQNILFQTKICSV